jgi:hypothetical protein
LKELYNVTDSKGFFLRAAMLTTEEAVELGANQQPLAGKLFDKNHCPRITKNGWVDDSSAEAKKVFAEHHYTRSPFNAESIS